MFFSCNREKVKNLSLRQLAVLGDAVCNLIERERAITNTQSARQLHEQTKLRVNALAQAQDLDELMDSLDDEEQDIVRRALNLKAHNYRKTSQSISRKSTAYEVLLGYLYLVKPDRLEELIIKSR